MGKRSTDHRRVDGPGLPPGTSIRIDAPLRPWKALGSRLIGLHAVRGMPGHEVVRWDGPLPHATFLRAVERLAPEVLTTLRDVLDGHGTVAAWAARWRLDVPWMLDVAEATLAAWRFHRVPTRLTFRLPVLMDVRHPPRISLDALRAVGMQRDDLDDDRRTPANPADVERLVRWHVLGWSPERIAEAELARGLRGNLRARVAKVRRVVAAFHALLSLAPRPKGSPGRPRKTHPR